MSNQGDGLLRRIFGLQLSAKSQGAVLCLGAIRGLSFSSFQREFFRAILWKGKFAPLFASFLGVKILVQNPLCKPGGSEKHLQDRVQEAGISQVGKSVGFFYFVHF